MMDLIDIAWLVGLVGLGIFAARAARAARLGPDATVERTRVLAAAGVAAVLAVGAAWVWGIAPAHDGMDRIADSPRGAARARLFVRAVAIPLPGGHTTVGYASDGGVRLPASYDLDEEQRGWDLVDVSADGAAGLALAPHTRPEPTTTRVLLAAIDRDHGAPPLDADAAAALAARLLDHHACRESSGAVSLRGPGAAVAVLCRGAAPVAALVMERDLSTSGVRATPLVWRGTRFVAHQVDLAAGEVLEVGRAADVAPGLTAWEVPAPAGQARIVVPPDDVLAPCRAWSERAAVFTHADPIAPGDPDAIACVLPYAPPFVLEVRRLVPDVGGIEARALWAAGLFATVALFALVALASRRRGDVTRRRFARALAGAWLGVAFAGVAVARLLWAHRIDMMRDFEPVGARVIGNQVSVVLAAAALACASARDGARATGRALAAWLIVVAGGGWALRADADAALATRGLAAQIALSLALGTAGAWAGPCARALVRLRSRLAALAPSPAATIGPAAPLVVIAAAAAGAVAYAPHAVVVKLALAWTAVVVAYHALRRAREGGTGTRLVTAAAAVLATGALARLDAGVTAAIVVPGLATALIMLGHDARFGAGDVGRLDAFERDHAPVVIAHAIVIGGAALAVGAWALTTGRADLPVALTRGALGGALVLGALLAIVGAVALRRRGARAAAPWLALAAACGGLWIARDAAIAHATDGNSTAAGRVAQILDPGAALLRDPERLVAGMTATRETTVDGDAWRGQGYFGAQVVDPGVLLSIENDYAPVLVLREQGVAGILRALALLVAIVAGLWWVSGERFAHGSPAQRSRRVVVATLGGLAVYQPLASLGLLPLTGIAWPGLGLDSPTDLWALVAIALFVGLGAPPATAEPDPRHDRSLRTARLFRRARFATAAAAALALVAAVIVVGRGALHAATRPAPLDDDGRAQPGFEPLADADDYAAHLVCPIDPGALAPTDVIGQPADATSRRFHADLRAAFARDRARGADELARFAKDPARACSGDAGAWRFARTHDADADTCDATWRFGWPTVHVSVTVAAPVGPPAGPSTPSTALARCTVELSDDALAAMRPRAPRRPDADRIRLVSEAMGAAARDRGELVAGHLVVRLRPGAGAVDVGAADAGLYAGDPIHLAPGADLGDDAAGRAILHVDAKADVALLESGATGWTLAPARGDVALDRAAIVVVGRDAARRVWSFRPARAWSGDPAATVAPLLADDVGSIAGRRRRHYVYGGDLPELGWVNPYHARQSLGLDGWVHVAHGETSRAASWLDGTQPHAWCGTLDAIAPPAAPDPAVCAPSPDDGVTECRVTVQPELELQLRHLTEIIAADLAELGRRQGRRADAGELRAPARRHRRDRRGGRRCARPRVERVRAVVVGARALPRAPARGARPRDGRQARRARRGERREVRLERADRRGLGAQAADRARRRARRAGRGRDAVPGRVRRRSAAAAARPRRHDAARGHVPRAPRQDGSSAARTLPADLARRSRRELRLPRLPRALVELVPGRARHRRARAARRDAHRQPGPGRRSHRASRRQLARRDADRRRARRRDRGQRARRGHRAAVARAALAALHGAARPPAVHRRRRDLPPRRRSPRPVRAARAADRRAVLGSPPPRRARPRRVRAVRRSDSLHDPAARVLPAPARLRRAPARLARAARRRVRARRLRSDDRRSLPPRRVVVPDRSGGPAPRLGLRAADAPVEATRGAGGGLCGVVQKGGTAGAGMKPVLADPRVIVYGAKTGTIDSLADVARATRRARRGTRRTRSRPPGARRGPAVLATVRQERRRRQPVRRRVRREDRPRRGAVHARARLPAHRQGRDRRARAPLHRRDRRVLQCDGFECFDFDFEWEREPEVVLFTSAAPGVVAELRAATPAAGGASVTTLARAHATSPPHASCGASTAPSSRPIRCGRAGAPIASSRSRAAANAVRDTVASAAASSRPSENRTLVPVAWTAATASPSGPRTHSSATAGAAGAPSILPADRRTPCSASSYSACARARCAPSLAAPSATTPPADIATIAPIHAPLVLLIALSTDLAPPRIPRAPPRR